MKILLALHGYPPELVGGTELAVRNLALALLRAGHQVIVVAGSMDHGRGFRRSRDEDRDPISGRALVVHRIHRADLYFDHWQKSDSVEVARSFRAILAEERPDVVHVHHWIRLTRSLVAEAAALEVPSVVTLHDLWTTCLVAFRVRPGEQRTCTAVLAPEPCLGCAGGLAPRTPWRERGEQAAALEAHQADLLRELRLARAVLAPTAAHGRRLLEFLGAEAAGLTIKAVPHGRDREALPSMGTRGFALEEPSSEQPLLLGSWGHFHPLKGQDLLIEAVGRMQHPDRLLLRLAGGEVDRDYMERLRQQASHLPVEFHGPFGVGQDTSLADSPVARVHAMLSGSRAHESWGLVIDEALALGIPMILPRVGAFTERLSGGACFYEPGDAQDLARSLDRIVGDPDWLARIRGQLPSLDRCVPDLEESAGTHLDIYQAALAEGAPDVPAVDVQEEERRLAMSREWDLNLQKQSGEALGLLSPSPEEQA